MPDYTVKIDLPDHKRGDKWPGIPAIGPVIINGSQPAQQLVRVRMQFRKGSAVYTLDSDHSTTPDAPVTITNATTWAASIPAVQAFLPTAGLWTWDMEFYQAGDTAPLTLYRGTITVHNDTTRP